MMRSKENSCVRMLTAACRLLQRIRRELIQPLCDPYRPERHYMRGPGPKHRAKH